MIPEDQWVPISALSHYSFCPRRVVLIHSENIWCDNQWTADGKILHEKSDTETRKSTREIRFVRSLRIHNPEIGVYGVADVVEFKKIGNNGLDYNGNNILMNGVHLPNIEGRWFPYPIEFKRGKIRTDESYEIQLCAQSFCLEYIYNIEIPYGYLYFGESGKRKKIDFSIDLRNKTTQLSNEVRKILYSDIVPRADFSAKCRKCSLEPYCLPEISKVSSAKSYIQKYLSYQNQMD